MYRMLGVAAAALLLLLILLTWFYHGYFRRAHMAFFHPEFFPRDAAAIAVIGPRKAWWKRLPLWLLSLAAALLTLNVMHISGIFLLHVAAVGAVMHLIYLLFKSFIPALLRRVHFSGVLPVLCAALVMVFGWWNLHHVSAACYTVTTDKPIREEGIRAVLIADVHYGVSLNHDAMQTVCDEISALSPDVVLLCGDMVDNDTPRESVPELFSMLGGIRAKEGVYFVYGNHDRPYSMIGSEYTDDFLLSSIRQAGITVLQDDLVPIGQDLLLIGREDASRGSRMSAQALLENADTDRFLLVMDHQPADYSGVGPTSADLLVSGHTHGGQIFPLGQLMRLLHINDSVYGYTRIDSDTAAIVTSGLAGWRYPVKTNAPAEYAVIDILPR